MKKKIIGIFVMMLLIASIFGSAKSGDNLIIKGGSNEIIVNSDSASSSENVAHPSNVGFYVAQLDYTCMCTWVSGWQDHGPCKTNFDYGQRVYFYGEVSGAQIGDVFSSEWKKDGVVMAGNDWDPIGWSGTGAIVASLIPSVGTWKVAVYCNDQYIGSGPQFQVTQKNRAPGIPLKPSGPTNATVDIPSSFTTHSTDADNDNVKYGWDWNADGIVDEWTDFYASRTTINISHSWDNIGMYLVRVRAEDIHGAQSAFSAALEVVVSIPANRPPDIPNIIGPASGKAGDSYTYSASTTDPDGDKVFFWFEWDDGTVSGWKGSCNSGETYEMSHIWNAQGNYSIKVKAKDIGDLESDWATLQISMPKNKAIDINSLFLNFLEQHPRMFPLLRQLLGL